jgi:hypothetical protein
LRISRGVGPWGLIESDFDDDSAAVVVSVGWYIGRQESLSSVFVIRVSEQRMAVGYPAAASNPTEKNFEGPIEQISHT